MKHLFLLTILLFSQRGYALEECKLYPSLTGLDRLTELTKSHSCSTLDKSTWEPGWNSPCDCLRAKDMGTILTAKYQENKEKFDNLKKEATESLANRLKQQIFAQFEASLRMDIYLKKGLISTETMNRKNSAKKGANIPLPVSCRLSKIDDIIANTNNPKNCNQELKNKRLKLIFGDEGNTGADSFKNWKEKTKDLFANAALNKLSKEDRDNGLCFPYKSFLSLNNNNPLRPSYMRFAKDLGSFEAFQNWVKDPGAPVDGITLAAVKVPTKNNREIMRLIKSDPIFERMAKDPVFYEKIISNKNEIINESDEEIIRAMAESQNKDCEKILGKDDSTKSSEGVLTQFLCQEDFPTDFMADQFINIHGGRYAKKIKSGNKEDGQNVLTYHFYCSEKGVDPIANGNVLDILGDKEMPEKDYRKDSFINYILSPLSDLNMNTKKDGDKIPEAKMYATFNDQVCKYVPDECKNPATLSSASCTISKVSQLTMLKMLGSQVKDEEDLKLLGGFFSNPALPESELRKTLVEYKFSEQEIQALLTLREQLPAVVKYRAEAELRNILGTDKVYVLNDKFYKSDVFQKDPNIPYDLKQRILNNAKMLETDNLNEEKETDVTASLFSNYFVLGTIHHEKYLDGSAVMIDPGTGRPIGNQQAEDNVNYYQRQSFNSNPTSSGSARVPGAPTNSVPPKAKDEGNKPDLAYVESPTTPYSSTTAPTASKPNDSNKRPSSPVTLTSSETSSQTTTHTTMTLSSSSSSNKKKAVGNSSRDQEIENRLESLNSYDLNNDKDESVKAKPVEDNSEIVALQKELSREKTKLRDNSAAAISNQSRATSPFGGSYGSSSARSHSSNNNSNGVSDNANYANPYDPMDRAATGKREVESSGGVAASGGSAGGGGAGGSSGGASPHLSSSGASEESSEGPDGSGLSVGAKKKNGRFPAHENGESDPDDVCGYEQEMKCIIEFATIETLSPSIASFVDSLQFQGRSFKAIEIYKYKNNRKPAKYYIYSFGPSQDLSAADKEKLFKKVQELSKDAKKNRDQLKALSTKTMVLKKTEISKEEAIKLSGSILKLEDINKLSDRRANKS